RGTSTPAVDNTAAKIVSNFLIISFSLILDYFKCFNFFLALDNFYKISGRHEIAHRNVCLVACNSYALQKFSLHVEQLKRYL
ncbi:MAG: hypothetical protein WC098_07250, partial [Bacteroidales bacterium]